MDIIHYYIIHIIHYLGASGGTHLTVGAGGKPHQIFHQLLVNTPVLTSFHRQLSQLTRSTDSKLERQNYDDT